MFLGFFCSTDYTLGCQIADRLYIENYDTQHQYWNKWKRKLEINKRAEEKRALKQEMKIVTDDSDAMTRQEGNVWKMMISRSFFWWLKFHSISYHCEPLWTISKYHQHHTVVNTQWGLGTSLQFTSKLRQLSGVSQV